MPVSAAFYTTIETFDHKGHTIILEAWHGTSHRYRITASVLLTGLTFTSLKAATAMIDRHSK